jgi:flagellar basal body-associated protein FliL
VVVVVILVVVVVVVVVVMMMIYIKVSVASSINNTHKQEPHIYSYKICVQIPDQKETQRNTAVKRHI